MYIDECTINFYRNYVTSSKPWTLGRIKRAERKSRSQIKKDNPSYKCTNAKRFLVIGRKDIGLFCTGYWYTSSWCTQAVDSWKYKNYLQKEGYEVRIIHTPWACLNYEEMWSLGD